MDGGRAALDAADGALVVFALADFLQNTAALHALREIEENRVGRVSVPFSYFDCHSSTIISEEIRKSIAEAVGFEPTKGFNSLTGLSNQRTRPLCDASFVC